MTLSNELIRDYDELAASLGTTPKYNSHGQIIPIGRPEGKSSWIYSVYIGRALGFYNNWGLCFAMTGGFPGGCCKKYRNLEDARKAWEQGPVELSGKWRPPAPRLPLRTPGFEVDEDEMHIVTPPSQSAPSPAVSLLPREVEVGPPARIPLPVSALSESTYSSDEEEQMWKDAAWPEEFARPREDHADGDTPAIPLSPTISSVSSLSLSPAPSLTSGTISPGPVLTPAFPVTTFPQQSTPKISRRTLACPAVDRTETVRPLRRRQEATTAATPPASPTKRAGGSTLEMRPLACSPSKSSHREGRETGKIVRADGHASVSTYTLEPARVAVPKPKEIFVVVRGDFPGIYFDRSTAFMKLGANPGMKLVVFSSLSKASWYFAQSYMAGRVGVPVVVVADSEAE